MSRAAKAAKALRFRTCAKLYVEDTILERLAQDLQDMAAARRPCIQQQNAAVRQRHVARQRHLAPPIRPTSEIVWCGVRNGRVVINAVRRPVRPATRWMRVVSIASARVIAGKIVVSRRASLDLPAPGGPSRSRL
jgi:hypothetical protein